MEFGRKPPKNVVLDAVFDLYGQGLQFEAGLERALLAARNRHSPALQQLAAAQTAHAETMLALREAAAALAPPRPAGFEAATAAPEIRDGPQGPN